MLLTDITRIIRVLLVAFEAVASQDALTQRRIDQIGEVIGAVEDVAETEADEDATVAEKRIEEAHDIIHRIAAILAMEEGREVEEDGNGDGGGGGDGWVKNDAAGGANREGNTDPRGGEPLAEVAWDGTLEGENIEFKEDDDAE